MDQDPDPQDYSNLTIPEVDDRIEEAAAYISVVEDLRPTDEHYFNACYLIWKKLVAIPPKERHRLLDELDPGSVRSLWKASLSRYILDPERSEELLHGFNVWDDFPETPGEMYAYAGLCERYVAPDMPPDPDPFRKSDALRIKPVLQPRPGSFRVPQEYFTQYFFLHPGTGELHGRCVLKMWNRMDMWWVPIYHQVHVGLTLTPLEADAGADAVFRYPRAGSWQLEKGDLPDARWPTPHLESWSPFSLDDQDYVRVIAPGVYVGCAYRQAVNAEDDTDQFIYFVLVRKYD